MSGAKTYTLILNSQLTTNRIDTSAGISGYKYYVNWGAILPPEYTKFDVSFVFRSSTSGTDPVNTILLGMNLGNRTLYDQTMSQSNIIGAIIPKSYGSTRYYFESNYPDDSGFICSYPSNSYVTVTMSNLDGSANTNFPAGGYVLFLCFTVIE